MFILGINAYHPDSSCCLIRDGEILAAAEEERFVRIKHWAGLPKQAIQFCLDKAQIGFEDLDYLVVNRDHKRHFTRKMVFILKNKPSINFLKDRFVNLSEVKNLKAALARNFLISPCKIRTPLLNIEHHLAHLASAFFVSPFKEAAIVSLDGFGDFVSCMVARGLGSKIDVVSTVYYPHSLGLFYSALTQFLGFKRFGDEYKVMGLSAYGKPIFLEKLADVISLAPKGKFLLNLKYFNFFKKSQAMLWRSGEPVLEDLYSPQLIELLGRPRQPQEELNQFHCDLASSVQAMYERVFFHIVNYAFSQIRTDALCLAGGCALNSLANGKISRNSAFKKIFIQPASSDAGGAIGAAFYLYHQLLGKERKFVMQHASWGPEFNDEEIRKVLQEYRHLLAECQLREFASPEELIPEVASSISEGKIVGWFQGRMELGARALGNRSILADPRRPEMKTILNVRVKRREEFRPFAPAILAERAQEFFDFFSPDPFMLTVLPIRPEKRGLIPAVVHVDGTGRLQTVTKQENLLFWRLIKEFDRITGIPILLNTSFNENEPIVCNPKEALDCFLRTRMDLLVLGRFCIWRKRKIE